MTKLEQILSLYEDFKLHTGTLSGAEGFFDYRAPSSRHSDVTCFAYGIAETQSCLSLERVSCTSVITLDEADLDRRFYVKLKACLFQWETYICPISLKINGKPAYENQREFFENVNLGWPTIYFPIDSALLTAGENTLELSQGPAESALLVSKLDLLSLPAIRNHQQLTYRPAVRLHTPFTMEIYAPNSMILSCRAEGCTVLSTARSPLNADNIIVTVQAEQPEPALTLVTYFEEIPLVMPKAYPASADNCMVGTDSDDHRHDDSDETNRIISIFTNSYLGNFFQARPQRERNFHDLSSQETWEKRIRYLKDFNTKMSLSDSGNNMPFMPEMVGDDFVGKHFHEAYLYFCSALERSPTFAAELFLDVKKMRASESFGQSKAMFCDALKKMYASSKAKFGRTSVGSPSLLTSYEASSGFERVTIEPVSNVPLLIGAVRAAAPEMWGSHIPTDWYFGEPNDLTKAKKFLLAMQVLYLSGAHYIYAENSLFKTNAFSREDWEDAFCTDCRRFQREFYDYTIKNPREGQLKTDLAVIYGNNEYFMWHYDNRMAELPENDDWDIRVWGKWKDNSHHKCWRVIDAWLTTADNQHSKHNIINLDLFSGTPYGQVDIVPYNKAYDSYKAVALLGWNTYEEGFATKLYDYVSNGGTAFVSYCHFNTTDRCDLPKVYAKTAEVTALLGDFEETIGDSADGYAVLTATLPGAEILYSDSKGQPLVWKKQIGKGILYFGAFADYQCPADKKAVMEDVLRLMGQQTADIRCDNPNIFFTQRTLEDGTITVDALNVSSNGMQPESYTLSLADGRTFTGTAAPCTIQKTIIAPV